MTREELIDYVEEQRNLGIIPYHVYSTLIDGIYTIKQISRILKNNGFHVDEIVESDALRKLFGSNLFDTNFDPFINLNCCNVKRITRLKITW